MKNILKFLTLILILISLTSFGQEKLGHINSQNLIDLMPDSKKATDELAKFEKELQDEYTRLTTQFEKKYTEFQQKESSMSDVQLQNEYAELQEFQQRILEFEQSMLGPEECMMPPLIANPNGTGGLRTGGPIAGIAIRCGCTNDGVFSCTTGALHGCIIAFEHPIDPRLIADPVCI